MSEQWQSYKTVFNLPVRIYLFILQKILLMLHSFRMTTGNRTTGVYGNSEAQMFYKNISISYNYISLSSGLFHTVWHLTIVFGPLSVPTLLSLARRLGKSLINICCPSPFSHCGLDQQQTPPVYVLVFQTCLSLGRGLRLCYSSHRRCPDEPSEELWRTPSGMQLQCTHHQN